jgi:fumarate hydratase subunit alpha
MKEIQADTITQTVARLCQEANFFLGEDVLRALRRAEEEEESPLGKEALEQILENADVAAAKRLPLCQDCGSAVVLLEVGQETHITGGELNAAVEEGVRQGYAQGYLRRSIVRQPFSARVNTRDNTLLLSTLR